MMENIESRAFEAWKHAQDSPAVLGVFFHERILFRVETLRLAENGIRDAHFTDVVQERGNFEILKFGFFQAQFLSDAHTPFRQPGAVHAGVEIFQVEELVEGADDRTAKRGSLCFELLDAERLPRREGRGTFHGRRNVVVRHRSYQHNRMQEPEPDVEPELFTQAETA